MVKLVAKESPRTQGYQNQENFHIPRESTGFGLFIVVQSLLRSLENRDFPCRGDREVKVSRSQGFWEWCIGYFHVVVYEWISRKSFVRPNVFNHQHAQSFFGHKLHPSGTPNPHVVYVTPPHMSQLLVQTGGARWVSYEVDICWEVRTVRFWRNEAFIEELSVEAFPPIGLKSQTILYVEKYHFQ